jgi:hypothetical protein
MQVEPGTFAFESQDGASPVRRPPRTWAGHGSGAPCTTCGNPISETDIEYEVEMQPGSLRTLHFHFHCYQDWVAQLARE